MTATFAETTVGEIVAERPASARIFEKWGIDYCCGGRKKLEDVCRQKSLNLNGVVHELEDVAVERPLNGEPDLLTMPLADLADRIVFTHHAYLKEELPRLSWLIEKVANAHGQHHPSLCEVRVIFEEFRAEIETHMFKEEKILFPMCRMLDDVTAPPAFHCGSIKNPIWVMEQEHQSAGDALQKLRELTHGFNPPVDACNTYRVMLHSLEKLEADMHQHVHKENNILFPRAVAAEAQFADHVGINEALFV